MTVIINHQPREKISCPDKLLFLFWIHDFISFPLSLKLTHINELTNFQAFYLPYVLKLNNDLNINKSE